MKRRMISTLSSDFDNTEKVLNESNNVFKGFGGEMRDLCSTNSNTYVDIMCLLYQ